MDERCNVILHHMRYSWRLKFFVQVVREDKVGGEYGVYEEVEKCLQGCDGET
jgi:hypothetical protein